jgi:hypothetical protein
MRSTSCILNLLFLIQGGFCGILVNDTTFFCWTLALSKFLLSTIFWKPPLFPFSGREAFNLMDPLTSNYKYSQSLGTIHTIDLWRYVPKNRPSPLVVTGQWLLKNTKLTTFLKSTTWTNLQIKKHTKSHKLRLIRPQTQHRLPGHMYFKNSEHH